jgi:hypothetical protein
MRYEGGEKVMSLSPEEEGAEGERRCQLRGTLLEACKVRIRHFSWI